VRVIQKQRITGIAENHDHDHGEECEEDFCAYSQLSALPKVRAMGVITH